MLKTLVWEGYQRGADGEIRGNGSFRELDDPTQVSDRLANERDLLWLDLTSPSPEEIRLIAEEFQLHPLAVEDATKHSQRPKIDGYDNFYLMVVFAIETVAETEEEAAAGASETALAAARFNIHEI